ncbi:MAG: RNA pseudouridine synthase [Planctomycetota bacterium]|jgi:23S rRNA pseudouridine1911/1915/1917 synthase|nr:RNA pseudouridine synthase [Planctomycetota bacterium]
MESGEQRNGFRVAHLDNHLLAADKPAGLPSQPDASGDRSLVDLAREYIRREFSKPGRIFLSLMHRLDRPTSGLVLLARTSKAAGRLGEAFRKREIEKTYLALVEGLPGNLEGGECRNWLARTGNGGMRSVSAGFPGAREARLFYRPLALHASSRRSLLAVSLETGVKHQIRCQLALAGLPVAGDFRYGPFSGLAKPTPIADGRAVLLHAWKIALTHPVRRETLSLSAPPPAHWLDHLAAFPDADKLIRILNA